MTDLASLIERVAALPGPDRETDAAVWAALTGAEVWSYDDNAHIDALIRSGAYRGDKQLHPDYDPDPRVTWRYRIGDAEYDEVPVLTASVDAALAFAERVHGNRWFGLVLEAIHDFGAAGVLGPQHLARFILLATLKARTAE